MAAQKVLPARIGILNGPRKDLEIISAQDNGKLLDKMVGLLLADIPAFPVGTKLAALCYPEESNIGVEMKEIALDPVMSSHWAHECIYNFLKECSDKSLDSDGKILMLLSIERVPGPNCIVLIQDKGN